LADQVSSPELTFSLVKDKYRQNNGEDFGEVNCGKVSANPCLFLVLAKYW